jgi:tetratricopeptide (TPR) repeat protein
MGMKRAYNLAERVEAPTPHRRKISGIVRCSDRPTPTRSPSEHSPSERTRVINDRYVSAADLKRYLAKMEEQDLFEMLGISPHASTEEVVSAYQRQLFLWHPDRLSPEQESLKPLSARICARMGHAHQRLRDPERRAEHRTEVEQRLGTAKQRQQMARVTEASELAERAEVLTRRRQFEVASLMLERAIDLDPEPALYPVLLAWAQAEAIAGPLPRTGQTCSRYRVQIAILGRAIAQHPQFERARYYRGMLLKRSGYLDAAVRDFRAAAQLNPRNIGAAREVRLYELRQRRARTGWLQRWFGGEPKRAPR